MDKPDYKILQVEDEDHMIAAVDVVLGGQYNLRVAKSVAEARAAMKAEWPDLLLCDLGLPDEPGINLLKEVKTQDPTLDVLIITVIKDVHTAVEVMKLGANDYLQKPFAREDLLLRVHSLYEHWLLRQETDRLRSELYSPFHFENIVATSPKLLEQLEIARKMCRSDTTVLITGESGTGKELVARAIHCDGTRRRGPFIAVNCAQFTGTLLESELFGHEAGAFTGATAQRKGRFELADRGTLFLDEVGNTSAEMQAKILRVVETRQFERVGGQDTVEVDVRLIAATNADLEKEIRNGNFREDLYYRLNVVRIELPPLRQRKEDVPALCNRFLAKHCAKTGRHVRGITPEAMEVLTAYDWRGNVRELQNVLEMAVALEEADWVTTRYMPAHIRSFADLRSAGNNCRLDEVVQSFERRYLEEQLRVHRWRHLETAKSLGIHRNTLEYKIRKYGIREQAE
jgi:DNA-binding NtrC family response regulator